MSEARALIAAGRAAEARDRLDALHRAGRGGLLLQEARVEAFLALGDKTQALAVAREAANLYGAAACVLLGDALAASGLLAAAIGEYQRALRGDPRSVRARYGLGLAWLEAGEAEKAEAAFAEIAPEDAPPGLAAKRDEIAAMKARPRSDARYVRHLFDQFSADYDARMQGQLHYDAPAILRGLAELLGLAQRRDLAVLDLGCGTGLAGEAFRDLAARLDGIDLSPAMIEKARARGIYDALAVGDIESALAQDGHAYDLVIAADTLVYLGDLATLFRGAAARLRSGGHVLFTVERKDGDGFELGPKRRWRHSEAYLRACAAAAGFDVAGLLECHPRTEAGVPVEGLAVALERLAEKVG